MTATPTTRAVLLLALPAISWGGMFHVAQRILPLADPFWLTLLRLLPTALTLLLLLAVTEPQAPPAGAQRLCKAAWSGLVGFAGFNFAAYSGLMLTTPEHCAIIMSLTPLLGALLAWAITRRAPPVATLICIGIALFGAILVIGGGGRHNAAPHGGLGDALVLLGALAWALYLRTSAWFPGWSSLRFSAMTTATGALWIALGLAGFSLAGWSRWPLWSAMPEFGAEFAYVILIGTLLGLLLWNRGVALLGPVDAGLYMNLVPVSAFVIGVLRGHRPAPAELLGAGLVLLALLANNFLLRRTIKRVRPTVQPESGVLR